MRLSRADLLAYGALGLPLAALNLPLALYAPTLYAEELGLGFFAVGVALALARLLDLITDPVLGVVCDRMRGPFGRRKLAIAIGAPVMLGASWLLFAPPEGAGILHLFFWSSIAYLGWTLVTLAYGAWGAELSEDYDERSAIATAREVFVILGVMAAAAAPAASILWGGDGEAIAPALLGVLVAMSVLTPAALLALFARIPDRAPIEGAFVPIREGLKAVFGNAPLKRLLTAHVANGMANGLPATLFLLFVAHRLEAGPWAGAYLIAYFASGVLAAPIWLRLSARIGKHRAWAAAMGWASLAFAAAPFLGPGDLAAFGAIVVLSGASLGADLALPAAMHADVVDLDAEIGGERRAGFLFALWGMANKLSLALAVFLAFAGLEAAGFDPETGEGVFVLALLYGALPIPFKLLAVGLIWRFGLDRNALAALRARQLGGAA